MATGVSRHQVDYYVENEGALPAADPTLTNILTEVLQKWHTDPQYVGPYGIPLELEFEVPGGGRSYPQSGLDGRLKGESRHRP